ncbi:MAG: TonB-dependent receptor [Planctomycetota bacterium]
MNELRKRAGWAAPIVMVLGLVVLGASGPDAADTGGNDEEGGDRKAEEEAPPPELDLPEMVVTGRREKASDGVEVFTKERIRDIDMSTTAEGVLENTAGVSLSRQRYSGNENQRLNIRGFDESRSNIMLNGRSLNGAGVYGGYYVDWDSMLVEDIERIELMRGASSAKYGNTLGGTLNIVTEKGSREPETIVRLRGGLIDEDAREDMWNGLVSHSGGAGPLLYRLSVAHHDSDGFLRNAYSERELFSGSLTWLLTENLDLTFSGRYNVNESGMIVFNRPDSPFYDPDKPESLGGFLGGPGLPFKHGPGNWGPYAPGEGSHWRDERLNLDTSLSYDTEDFGLNLQAYFLDQERKEKFFSASEPGHQVFKRESKPEKDNWGWRADFENVVEAAGTHTVEYGAEGNYLGYGEIDVKSFDPDYFISPGGRTHPNLLDRWSDAPDTITRTEGGYVQDSWRVNEWLELKPGLRFDSYSAEGPTDRQVTVEEDKVGPRFSATVFPWAGGNVTGRYARAHRFPTIPEHYWWNEGFQPPGRKKLVPEEANQWELEMDHEFSSGTTLTARGYYYSVDDYIRTVFGYRPSRVIYNVDNVELTGLELEFAQDLPHDFHVWANYTVQDTQKRGDVLDGSSDLTDELVELPENRVNVGIGYEKPNGLRADLTARYVDSRQAIRGDLTGNTPGEPTLEGIGAFVDLEFKMSYPFYRGQRLTEARWELMLDNLLDDNYEEEYGFPMPGLTAITGVRMKF